MRQDYDDDYDPANWWKQNNAPENAPKEVIELTETEQKIAHYEKRARYHWESWKEFNHRGNLYHYRQANIKVRKLKGCLSKP